MSSILDFNFDEEMADEPMDFNQFCLPKRKHCKLILPKESKTSKQTTRPQAQTKKSQEQKRFKSMLDKAGIQAPTTRKGHAFQNRVRIQLTHKGVCTQAGIRVVVKRHSKRFARPSEEECEKSLAGSLMIPDTQNREASLALSEAHTESCMSVSGMEPSTESSSDEDSETDELENLTAPPQLLRNRRTPLPTLIQVKPEDVVSVNDSSSISSDEASQNAETQQVAPPAMQQNVAIQPQAVPTNAATQYVQTQQYMYMQPQQMQPLQYTMQQPQQYTVQQPQYMMPPSPAMMQQQYVTPNCAPFTAPIAPQYTMPDHRWAMQQVSPTMQQTSLNGSPYGYSQGNYSTASTQTAYPPRGSCRSSCHSSCHSQQSAVNNTGAPVMPKCEGCVSCERGNTCTAHLKLINFCLENVWTPEESHAIMKAYPVLMAKVKRRYPATFENLEE